MQDLFNIWNQFYCKKKILKKGKKYSIKQKLKEKNNKKCVKFCNQRNLPHIASDLLPREDFSTKKIYV